MGGKSGELESIRQVSDATLDERIKDDSVFSDITYHGWAPLGTPKNARGWRILRIKTTADGEDLKGWPRWSENDPYSSGYDFVWNAREDYTYSQDE